MCVSVSSQTAKFESERKEREAQREDAIQMKHRLAQKEKERKLEEMRTSTVTKSKQKTDLIKEKHQKAEEEKQARLQKMKEEAKTTSASYSAGLTCPVMCCWLCFVHPLFLINTASHPLFVTTCTILVLGFPE